MYSVGMPAVHLVRQQPATPQRLAAPTPGPMPGWKYKCVPPCGSGYFCDTDVGACKKTKEPTIIRGGMPQPPPAQPTPLPVAAPTPGPQPQVYPPPLVPGQSIHAGCAPGHNVQCTAWAPIAEPPWVKCVHRMCLPHGTGLGPIGPNPAVAAPAQRLAAPGPQPGKPPLPLASPTPGPTLIRPQVPAPWDKVSSSCPDGDSPQCTAWAPIAEPPWVRCVHYMCLPYGTIEPNPRAQAQRLAVPTPVQQRLAAPTPGPPMPPQNGGSCPTGPIDVNAEAGGGLCICWEDYYNYALLPIFAEGMAKTAGQVDPTRQCADGMLAVIYWWCANAPLCGGEPDKIDAAFDLATIIAQHVYGGGAGQDVEGTVAAAQEMILPEVLNKAQAGPVCFTPGGQTMNPVKVGDFTKPGRQPRGLSLKTPTPGPQRASPSTPGGGCGKGYYVCGSPAPGEEPPCCKILPPPCYPSYEGYEACPLPGGGYVHRKVGPPGAPGPMPVAAPTGTAGPQPPPPPGWSCPPAPPNCGYTSTYPKCMLWCPKIRAAPTQTPARRTARGPRGISLARRSRAMARI